MSYTKRNCDHCKKEYMADNRNLKRGWGLCCSKSCASKKREMSKPGYCPKRVAKNNVLRVIISEERMNAITPMVYNPGKFQGYTNEGYRIFGGVAYDEWDDPVYRIDLGEDMHPHDSDNF